MLLQYLLVAVNSSESDKILVNESDGNCLKVVISDCEVHKADDVSEATLVGEIDDELDEDCEVHQADERMSWIRFVRWERESHY